MLFLRPPTGARRSSSDDDGAINCRGPLLNTTASGTLDVDQREAMSGAESVATGVHSIADSIEPLAQTPKHQSEPGGAAAEPQSISGAIRPPFVSSASAADNVLRVPSEVSVMTGAQLASLACKTLHSLEIPTDALVARYDRVLAAYYAAFGAGRPLEFVIRAPGRVNLIGEHIDYCGGSVLPMCIENDVLVAGARNSSAVVYMCNTNSKYPHKIVTLKKGEEVVIDKSNHHWTNYFMCGYKGVVDVTQPEKPLGLDITVDGTVPPGAGLSSSSAMVCASALVTITAQNADNARVFKFFNEDVDAEKYPKNREHLRRKRLVECAQRAERFVGTESGGMDQAISILGEKGFAARIDFNPLESTRVRLPHGASWVITNCLVEAHKVLSAATMYNARVVECRLASIALAKLVGVPDWASAFPLLRLCALTGKTRAELLQACDDQLPAQPMTEREIAALVDMPDIRSLFGDMNCGTAAAVFAENETFALRARARHVLAEASRVYEFEEVCKRSAYPEQWQDLGTLMCASHTSCAELYACSCRALDDLQQVCMQGGAFGARMTGAGWGGCVVSLVANSKLDRFLAHVQQNYYARLHATYGIALPPTQSDYMFVTQPACGARAMPIGSMTELSANDAGAQRTSASACSVS